MNESNFIFPSNQVKSHVWKSEQMKDEKDRKEGVNPVSNATLEPLYVIDVLMDIYS
ncbi:MAG: hypothetical protein MUO72_03985 [Bacteroidales bacterium]|nr:hypothetical protein [Bacteroidales bacterium]